MTPGVRFLLLAAVALVTACSSLEETSAAAWRPGNLPSMRWEEQPDGDDWTFATLQAIQDHGAALPATVPSDIEVYCPGYADASIADREAFWAGLLSTLAKHESTWRADAVGGGGRWFGLVQISPGTAKAYGCAAKSGNALKDGAANLSCAVRIMSHTVPRDGVVSAGMKGVAADWGPFHSARKRQDMIEWSRQQAYCTAT